MSVAMMCLKSCGIRFIDSMTRIQTAGLRDCEFEVQVWCLGFRFAGLVSGLGSGLGPLDPRPEVGSKS